MDNETINENYCAGCNACISVCPQKCISYVQNRKGFYVARIDKKICIKCGKCLKICPLINKYEKNEIRHAYIAVNRNAQDYARSSSGGLFPLVAKKILSENGIVWGCGYDSNGVPIHKCINTKEELDDLCRSKYVQSNMDGVIESIRLQLFEGKTVLFVGTPCQNAGIRNFFGKEIDNLILIDLFCHGVPSPAFFKENLIYLERKFRCAINRYEFRIKFGESSEYQAICFLDNGRMVKSPYYKDYYYNAFYNNLSLNDICYECPYANQSRSGDLTIGDYFWGKEHHKRFAKYDEISCILINSEKGNKLFERLKEELQVEETNLEWIMERNKTLIMPTSKPAKAPNFYKHILNNNYSQIVSKYYLSYDYIKMTNIVKKMKTILRRFFK